MVLAKDVLNFIVGRRRGILAVSWLRAAFALDSLCELFGREALGGVASAGGAGCLAVARLVPGPLLLNDSLKRCRPAKSS